MKFITASQRTQFKLIAINAMPQFYSQVVEKCRRGRYQPLLLLFAVPEGTPIDTSNAPKSITMATKAPLVPSPCKQPLAKQSSAPVLGGRRSLTPSPEKPSVGHLAQRRAVTPNPEQTNQEYIRAVSRHLNSEYTIQ